MVQVIDLPRPLSGKLNEMMAQGVGKNFPKPEQLVQQRMLSEAFDKLKASSGENFMDVLGEVAPSMMTVPGGSELLGQIAPIMLKETQNRAIREANIRKRGGAPGQQDQLGQQDQQIQPDEMALLSDAREEQALPESDVDTRIGSPALRPEDRFRKIEADPKAETLYPQITAGPQTQKILSQPELENYAMDVMEASGNTVSYPEAYQLAQKHNDTVNSYNQQILKEQELRQDNIREMTSGILKRAENSGLIKADSPEERTVLEKIAYSHRNEATPADQWEKTRAEFEDFGRAREAITRNATLPGPFSKIKRQMMGTYKDKEAVSRDLQPHLDPYRKYGLFNEARALLGDEIGMGAEDIERTLFPPNKEEERTQNSIPINKKKLGFNPSKLEQEFPSTSYDLEPDQLNTLKDDIGDYLEKFPESNLIALRGKLNQDKKYSWQDISKSMSELIEERRFTPDLIQNQQLSIINSAPLPGLTNIFDFWLKGTK